MRLALRRFPGRSIALVVLLASVAVGGTAQAASTSLLGFTNWDNIDIPDLSQSDPYPSSTTLDWCPGIVTDVQFWFESFSHGYPDDVDMMLVGPGGENAIIMSDAGGSTDAEDSGFGCCGVFSLSDDAPTALPDNSQIGYGATYRPANYGEGLDTFPAPAPAPSGASALSTFDGTSPAGTWSLFIVDDFAGDSGSVNGWGLAITASSSAGTHICFGGGPIGDPYPSTRTVSGLSGDVADVNLDITGLSHEVPYGLHLLLVGPGGQNLVVMSGAGGAFGSRALDFTLDDEAAAALPEDEKIEPGSYRPADYGTENPFEPPAPVPSGASALSVFDGTDPNGEWRLFAATTWDTPGVIADWSLDITMTPPTIEGKKAKAVEGKPLKFNVSRSGAGMGQTLELPFSTKGKSAKPGKDFAKKKGVLTLEPGQTSALVKIKTKNDQNPEKEKEKLFLRITLPDGTVLQLPGVIKDND